MKGSYGVASTSPEEDLLRLENVYPVILFPISWAHLSTPHPPLVHTSIHPSIFDSSGKITPDMSGFFISTALAQRAVGVLAGSDLGVFPLLLIFGFWTWFGLVTVHWRLTGEAPERLWLWFTSRLCSGKEKKK